MDSFIYDGRPPLSLRLAADGRPGPADGPDGRSTCGVSDGAMCSRLDSSFETAVSDGVSSYASFELDFDGRPPLSLRLAADGRPGPADGPDGRSTCGVSDGAICSRLDSSFEAAKYQLGLAATLRSNLTWINGRHFRFAQWLTDEAPMALLTNAYGLTEALYRPLVK